MQAKIEAVFQRQRHLIVLRGETGIGKTAVLSALAARGAQVLDLEDLAGHRGSAFGGLDLPLQPSHRIFQQRLAQTWQQLVPDRLVFSEHEGPFIGSVGLPTGFWQHLVHADWVRLRAPIDLRIERIVATYSHIPTPVLLGALQRLQGRLGLPSAGRIQQAIERGEWREAVCALLSYYDRAYAYQMNQVRGHRLFTVDMADRSSDEVAEEILQRCGWAP